MNTLRIEGNWNLIKGELKKQYAALTDNDLLYMEGKEDEIIGRVQRALGKTRDEVVNLINSAVLSYERVANPVTPDRDIEGSDDDIDDTKRQGRSVGQNR